MSAIIMSSSLITLSVLLFSSSVAAQGPTTQASCGPQYSWMFNSLGQSPCQVAAFLGTLCAPSGNYNVPQDPGGNVHYDPGFPPSRCDCTTVEYSLYSACAACQSASFSPWANWSKNCSAAGFGSVVDGAFPASLGIPNGTAVPAWAFQKILSSNPSTFNVSEAQLVGDMPEGLPSKPGAQPSSSTPSSTASPAPSTSSPPSAGRKNVGAIAGGVVGGVFGLAIIAALLTWCCLRRRRAEPQPPVVDNASTLATSSVYNPPMSSKPYNPDDPSTFPPTPMSFSHSSKPSMSVGSTLNNEGSTNWSPYDPTKPHV